MRRSERDGCQCRPWVHRCVHFEGQVLHIVDLAKHQELCEGRTLPHGHAWAVAHGPPSGLAGHIKEGGWNSFETDSLPDAEAEFDRRAEELRQQHFVKQA